MHNLLKRFAEAPGGSGFEQMIIALLTSELQKHVSDVTVDPMGNVVARIPGVNRKSVMVSVHSDEVCLLVKYIDPKGFLYFDLNGLIDERVLLSSRVDICSESGVFEGIIGVKSRHLLSAEDLRRSVSLNDLWIDVGAKSDDEVHARGIRIGDPVVFHPNFTQISEDTVLSKAIDNRAGCAVLVQIAEWIKSKALDYTLYLVAAVQEEIGSRGAKVVAQTLQPDMAIVIDTVPAADPATPPQQATGECGKGPVIRTMDVSSTGQGTIYSQNIRRHLIKVAEKHAIPYQRDIFRTWTDASTIHLAGKGIPTGGIFIPRRYGHSPAELVKLPDVENTGRLLLRFLEELDSDLIESLIRKI